MQVVFALFTPKILLVLVSCFLASNESFEELVNNQNQLATDIRKSTPGLFYDGNFKKLRESPYPLNEGDFLVLLRRVSLKDGRFGLTFHKHNSTCSRWKRFKHDHLSLTCDTKKFLVYVKRVMTICGSIGFISGGIIGGIKAAAVFLSGGTSYRAVYVLGGSSALIFGYILPFIPPFCFFTGKAVFHEPIIVSPRKSCCARPGEDQLYSVVYVNEEVADFAKEYARGYMDEKSETDDNPTLNSPY